MLDGQETVRDSMLDGQENVEIACGEFRWEGARQHAGRKETVQIAWGELRGEVARQHAGRRGNCANSLGRASLGGSETACWTDTKPCKYFGDSFAGKERDSMLDGQETMQIACGKLRWEGARPHAGRTGNRANSLRKASLGGGETACWTDRKACK